MPGWLVTDDLSDRMIDAAISPMAVLSTALLFGGIGRALALQLHARGCRVAAVGRGLTGLATSKRRCVSPPIPPRPRVPRWPCLGGMQTANQVAEVMAWLLDDGAARLTGQAMAVDGGFTTVRPLVKWS